MGDGDGTRFDTLGEAYDHVTRLRPCGPRREAVRGATYDLAAAPGTAFFVTASADGHVKFWKKVAPRPPATTATTAATTAPAAPAAAGGGIEFAKHYRAHLGPVAGLAVSADGFVGAGDHRVKLTGAAMDRRMHRERAEVDAIAVGANTMMVDDPLLTARACYRYRPLTRVVFDSCCRNS